MSKTGQEIYQEYVIVCDMEPWVAPKFHALPSQQREFWDKLSKQAADARAAADEAVALLKALGDDKDSTPLVLYKPAIRARVDLCTKIMGGR